MDGVWIRVNGEWVKATTGSQAEIEAHVNNTENPHKVTKEQVGLGNVKNVEQASKSELELHERSTGHITEIERDQWNKKETPEGAQEKAEEAFERASGYMDEVLELYETKESAVSKLDEAKRYTDKAFDDAKRYTDKAISDALSVPSEPTEPTVIYGVEIDEDNPDPFGAVTYIADSEGFEPLYTGDENVSLGSWGDKFPINKVKVVLMKDGEVVEELDKNDHTKTIDGRTVDITSGDSGDVMVAIPLTYWKFERVGSKLRIYVSDGQPDEEYKAYTHSRDGVVQDDYLYIGAYKGNVQDDKLRSLHDVMSTGNVTIGKFREYATNNGAGYGQMNWATMTLMQIFTVLLAKSLDIQTALGRGYVSGRFPNINDDYIKNGETTKKGLFYGETTGQKQMKFLGVEDFWGNRFEWVDGLVREGWYFFTNTNNTNYNNDAVGYTEAYDNAPNFDYHFKKVTGTTESGFIPAEKGGSSSTYYCASYWSSFGHKVVAFGSDHINKAGAFQLAVNYDPTDTDETQGARLIYLKGGN